MFDKIDTNLGIDRIIDAQNQLADEVVLLRALVNEVKAMPRAHRQQLDALDDPRTATRCAPATAYAYRAAADVGRAIPLYETTLADSERVSEPDHPTTKVVRQNLDHTRRT